MNFNLLQKIVINKKKLVPYLFTNKQILLINNYLKHKPLTNTEKTYLYSSIKKKIDALALFEENYCIKGTNMISSRVEDAKKILSELNQKAFISGSFLFKKKYEDIDIFIISKKRNQYVIGNKHYIHITQNDLTKVIFASAANYSVANFQLPLININYQRTSFDDIILNYQLILTELSQNEPPKSLKYLLIAHNLLIKKKLLNSYELYLEYKRIVEDTANDNKLFIINLLTKELLLNSFSKSYLNNVLGLFTKNLAKQILTYSDNNLIICKKLIDEIKNECRRTKK